MAVPPPAPLAPPVSLPMSPSAVGFMGIACFPFAVLGAASLLEAGVWKKSEADRFFCVELGGWDWFGWTPMGGEDEVLFLAALSSFVLSTRKVSQPESMCWLIRSSDLTPLLQIGHTTMAKQRAKIKTLR